MFNQLLIIAYNCTCNQALVKSEIYFIYRNVCKFIISLHCYEIFAQIAEKMSRFGAVDVKQYTPKRVLVAVANHGRLVIYRLFSISFFPI